jgi:hypothetical protein
MKSLLSKLGLGAVAIVALYFFLNSTIGRKYEAKFSDWKADFTANYRTKPETLKVRYDSIHIVTRWLAAKPLKLTAEDSITIAQKLFGLSLADKDSLLTFLSAERQAEPVTETDSVVNDYGETIKVTSTHWQWISPLQENPFGRFSLINEVIYPRSATTVIETYYVEPLIDGLFLKIGGASRISDWKMGASGAVEMPFNIGGGRQIVPGVRYDTFSNRGLAELVIIQKLF